MVNIINTSNILFKYIENKNSITEFYLINFILYIGYINKYKIT